MYLRINYGHNAQTVVEDVRQGAETWEINLANYTRRAHCHHTEAILQQRGPFLSVNIGTKRI